MADHVSVEVEGLASLMAGLERADVRLGTGLHDLLDDLRKRGEHYIRLYAPAHSGDILRRIDSTTPVPHEGGLQAIAGVRAGDRHPLYVHRGTGIYAGGRLGGRFPAAGGGGRRIYSRTPGRPMTFQKRGEPRKFRMWTRGQRANPFVLYAFQQLIPYARGRIHRFDITRGRG
jgi:hypothetical protein